MECLGRIAVIGSGSWATALAKLLLRNCDRIVWYVHREERISEFRRCGHNPVYLTDIPLDVGRIDFTSDINGACSEADTLLVVVPSPFLTATFDKLTVDISGHNVVSAVKGIVPDSNIIVTDYFERHFGVGRDNVLAIGGPCHAEEVALERLSYLTIGCRDTAKSEAFCRCIDSPAMKTIVSPDVEGIEYAAVLKNVYAIAAGMISGMRSGDNFKAMMVSNAIREMERFVAAVAPLENRDIDRSAYLGDLLVTAYSRFSRNHNFGAMIGKGYSVKAAKMEMEMVAEGYYGAESITRINNAGPGADMPILRCVYSILYEGANPRDAFRVVAETFS